MIEIIAADLSHRGGLLKDLFAHHLISLFTLLKWKMVTSFDEKAPEVINGCKHTLQTNGVNFFTQNTLSDTRHRSGKTDVTRRSLERTNSARMSHNGLLPVSGVPRIFGI